MNLTNNNKLKTAINAQLRKLSVSCVVDVQMMMMMMMKLKTCAQMHLLSV